MEKPTPDNPMSENPTQLNKELLKTNLPNKEKLNTDISSTHSIPFHSLNPSPLEDAAQPPERKRKEATDAYRVYEEIIKDNIEYEHFIKHTDFEKERFYCFWSLIWILAGSGFPFMPVLRFFCLELHGFHNF